MPTNIKENTMNTQLRNQIRDRIQFVIETMVKSISLDNRIEGMALEELMDNHLNDITNIIINDAIRLIQAGYVYDLQLIFNLLDDKIAIDIFVNKLCLPYPVISFKLVKYLRDELNTIIMDQIIAIYASEAAIEDDDDYFSSVAYELLEDLHYGAVANDSSSIQDELYNRL